MYIYVITFGECTVALFNTEMPFTLNHATENALYYPGMYKEQLLKSPSFKLN